MQTDSVTVVEDRSIMSAEYPLPLLANSDPRSSLYAIAELLVSHFHGQKLLIKYARTEKININEKLLNVEYLQQQHNGVQLT